MDGTTWIALLGIMGTLGGAGLGQWIAFRSKRVELKEQRFRDDRSALLAGIRELHRSIIEYNQGLVGFVSKVLRSRADLLSSNVDKRFDAADEMLMPLHKPWATMSSLQLLYASELNADWLKVGAAQDDLLTATNNFLGDKIGIAEFTRVANTLSAEAMNFVNVLTDKYLFISGDPFFHSQLLVRQKEKKNKQEN